MEVKFKSNIKEEMLQNKQLTTGMWMPLEFRFSRYTRKNVLKVSLLT